LTDRSERSKLLETVKFVSKLEQHENVENTDGLDPQMALLRVWQSERLARTHNDLLKSKRYGPPSRFFLSDLYSVRDFSQRDQDIEKLYELMRRFVPDILLALVRNAAEINDLTKTLDESLLAALVEKLGVTDTITHELYAKAYRICDNYDERKYQIDLLAEIGKQVEFSTRVPFMGATVKLAGGPARRAGWHELHDFIERGFAAFKHMGKAKYFLSTMQGREMEILDRIFENHPDPFSLNE